MLPRKLNLIRPVLSQSLRPIAIETPARHSRLASRYNEPALGHDAVDPAIADPNMNGGYVNPPALKRALRDPYADWWDKQERRNFGEPVHEDNDVLGVFSTEPYTHAKPMKAWLSFGAFVVSILGLCAVVNQYYPDKPSTPRTFADGLDKELGGLGAQLANKQGEEEL